jgi:hypothetical protein
MGLAAMLRGGWKYWPSGSEEPGFRSAAANYGKKVSRPSGYLTDVS